MYLAIYQFIEYHARLEDIVSFYLNYTLFMLVLIVMVILKTTVTVVCGSNTTAVVVVGVVVEVKIVNTAISP